MKRRETVQPPASDKQQCLNRSCSSDFGHRLGSISLPRKTFCREDHHFARFVQRVAVAVGNSDSEVEVFAFSALGTQSLPASGALSDVSAQAGDTLRFLLGNPQNLL